MDRQLEEKLDNFEGLLENMEKRCADGENPKEAQIVVLKTALKTLTSQNSLAKWWKDEMEERIGKLAENVSKKEATGKFPEDPLTDSYSSLIPETDGWYSAYMISNKQVVPMSEDALARTGLCPSLRKIKVQNGVVLPSGIPLDLSSVDPNCEYILREAFREDASAYLSLTVIIRERESD